MIGTHSQDTELPPPPAAIAKRPPVWGWIVLGVLVIGALAYGLIRDDVLLEDDFSTPEVLRTWPYDDPHLDYENDEYHITLSTADEPVSAFHELPHEVEAMTMTVSMRNVRGEALAVLECSTEVNADESAGTVMTKGYVFVIDPATGSFAITDTDFSPIDDGTLVPLSQATVGCASDGSTTALTLRVPGEDPYEVDLPGGTAFEGIALGAMAPSLGAELAFDDLRVTETN